MLKDYVDIDKQVIVCVPIYKNTLSAVEWASLRQLNKILGKYQRVFVAPQSLEFDFGNVGEFFRVERFPDYFFHSVLSYSALMLNVEFYRRFHKYEYVLIYQTDAFVFSDCLLEFCRLGYDYIGAPLERANPLWSFIGNRVGNGGLSLRKVSSAIRMLENWDRLVGNSPLVSIFWQWEDLFWSYCAGKEDWNFKIPPINIAVEFAVQDNVCRAYKRLQAGWRPFGCHGWSQTKEDYEAWLPIIEGCGFDFSGEKILVRGKYSRSQNYCQNHGKLNTHYLWGLYRNGYYNKFLTVLDDWLEKFSADFAGWQSAMEDFVCLWRLLETEHHNKTWLTACQLRLTEAINRSLHHGVKQPLLWNMLITMVPWLRKYDYPGMQSLANNISNKWWEMWAKNTNYQQTPYIIQRKRRVVVLTQVRDDAVIVESFVRHTLTFADAILVDIRLATSRTLAIIKSLEQEGLPLLLHEKKLSPAQVHDGDDIVLELTPYDFLLPQMGDIDVRIVLENMVLSENSAVENWQYAIYLPFAYRDKFVLTRPLLRQMTSKKYRLLSYFNEEKTQIVAALYLATVKDIYGDDLANGVIPADMELVDISGFALSHELRYTNF